MSIARHRRLSSVDGRNPDDIVVRVHDVSDGMSIANGSNGPIRLAGGGCAVKRLLILIGLPVALLVAGPAKADPSPAEVDYLNYLAAQRVSGTVDNMLHVGYDACSDLQQGNQAPVVAMMLVTDAQTSGTGLTMEMASAVVGGATTFLCPGH